MDFNNNIDHRLHKRRTPSSPTGSHSLTEGHGQKPLLAFMHHVWIPLVWTLIVFAPVIASADPDVIRSAAEIDYPPFSIVDENGQADGFAVELMRASLKAMGHKGTFRTGPWHQVRNWLEIGEIDALPLVGRTPEREALFDFTVPYMSLHGAIVVRGDNTDIKDFSDLDGLRVAVMKGDNAEEFLRRKHRDFNIHTTPTFEVALQELARGRYDAVVTQRLVALRLIQKTGLTNLRVIDQSSIEGFTQDFCFAVREGDRETLALLNEGLAIAIAEGTYRHLHAKWFAALQLPTDRPIVVGGDRNFPPFEFLDENGRPAGYNVDLTRAIARETGLNIEIRLGHWPERMEALKTGEIDIIQGMFYSPDRDMEFDFSQPHTVSHYVAVVRSGEGPAPQSVEDLLGKRIVAERGDILHEFAVENNLEKQLSLADDQEIALRELSEGKHDCAMVSRITALYLIKNRGWSNLLVGKKPLVTLEYGFAGQKGQKAVLAHFSEGLKALENSDEYRRIHDKWLGVYQEPPATFLTVLRYSALVILPLLALLTAAFAWSWTLRRQVAQKTDELQKKEQYLRAVIACSPVALYTVDTQGTVLTWNSSSERVFGWPAREIVGKPLPIIHADEHGEFDDLKKRVFDDGGVFGLETMRKKKDGTLFPVRLFAAPVSNDRGDIVGILGVVEDITERKAYETRIAWNLQRDALLSSIAARLLQSDDPQIIIEDICLKTMEFLNCQAFFNFLEDRQQGQLHLHAFAGIPAQEARKIEWLQHGVAVCGCVAENRQPMICENLIDRNDPLTDLVKSFGIQAYCCHPLARRDRLIGTLSFGRRSSVRFAPEEIEMMSSVANLVAMALSRFDTEKKLRDSESRFRMLAELAPVGIVISDERKNTLYSNPRFTEIFGYSTEDMPTVEQWWELAYPDESLRSQAMNNWNSLLDESKRTHSEFGPVEYPVTCKDGTVRQVEFRTSTTGNLNVVIFTDVTDRKKNEAEKERLQAQLIQAQKMESVGRLAGGVAHDYNNMLSVIIGFTEMALEKPIADEALREDLLEILDAAHRSTDITRQLLAFARRQIIAPSSLDLNEAVEKTLKMLRRLIGEDIDLSWKPGPGALNVFMDSSQVDQMLANLCVNARDAIDGVGKITIETKLVHFSEKDCAAHADLSPGDFVMLAISDNGCGMDKTTMENIFEPFYTTKEVGEGTGLGLSTVYGIVKQNNGFINVYSEQGQGTTLRIYLSFHAGKDKTEEVKPIAASPSGNGEVILVVEDEASILKLAKQMLEGLGYNVLTASLPDDAIAMAREHHENIHLLITDVVMPHMNGRELSRTIQNLYPKIKVLFMSGYTANVIAHHGVLDENVNFIQKPFVCSEMAVKVQEALASTRHGSSE